MYSYFVKLPNSRFQIGEKVNTAIRKYRVRGRPQVPLYVSHTDVLLGRYSLSTSLPLRVQKSKVRDVFYNKGKSFNQCQIGRTTVQNSDVLYIYFITGRKAFTSGSQLEQTYPYKISFLNHQRKIGIFKFAFSFTVDHRRLIQVGVELSIVTPLFLIKTSSAELVLF